MFVNLFKGVARSDNLLSDQRACGRLRTTPVAIAKSVYQPLAVPQLIDECFQQNPCYVDAADGKQITVGDFMRALFTVKGSKSDWWYELFGGFTSLNINADCTELSMTVGFDHGS